MRTLSTGFFTAIFLLAASHAVVAADNRTPDEFIRAVGQEAITSLTGKELTDKQRQEGFRTILVRTFEVPLIARFTLGRFWRRASEQQQKEFVRLFEDFVVQAYAARFKDYSGHTFTVGKVREIDERDSYVQSTLALKDGRNIAVLWRVRGKSDPKIIDVVVEGVSMAITQRDEFASIINQKGGKVEGLIAALREKTAK